jgi:hypothetical protein
METPEPGERRALCDLMALNPFETLIYILRLIIHIMSESPGIREVRNLEESGYVKVLTVIT